MIGFRRSDAFLVGAAALATVFGVVLNPFLTTQRNQCWAVIGIASVTALTALSIEVSRSLKRVGPTVPEPAVPANWFGSALGLVAVAIAWAFLYRCWWTAPRLFADDYHYITQSRDWETTRRNLFIPYNEHLVPVTRVVTWLLVLLGGERPIAGFAAFTALLFLTTTLLVFLVGRRVGGGDLPGLAAAAWFAVSTTHSEIVSWYSASQWMISACLLLASLLLVDRPGWRPLLAATLLAAAAPWSYSIGVIVGPFVSFWVWTWHRRRQWRSLPPAAVGVVSSVIAVSIVRHSMNDETYWKSGGRGLWEAFDPLFGFLFSTRFFAEHLVPTQLVLPASDSTNLFSALVIAVEGLVAVAALRWRPQLARLWPAAVLILLGYGVTIPFRTWQSYGGLVYWNRYQLVPQLGAALLAAGVVGSFATAGKPLTIRSLLGFLVGLTAWTALQSIHTFRWN